MKLLQIFIILLLTISLIANYVMYYNYNRHITNKVNYDTDILNNLNSNINYTKYTIFYNKNKKYEKCRNMDKFTSNKSSNNPMIEIEIDNLMRNFVQKFSDDCIVLNNKNNYSLNMTYDQIQKINSIK